MRAWLDALPTPTSDGPLNNYLGAGDPRHDSRQLRLLPGPLRPAVRQQRPHVRQLLAPAGAGQVRVDAAAVDRQRDLLRSAELVGEPLQLGSHVQPDAAEPHVDGLPESQRRLRLGQPGLRRRLPADSPASPATRCRRRSRSATASRTFGNNAGINVGNITTRPTFIINDMVTWTRGAHTLKVGMEYRKIMGNIHNGDEPGRHLQLPARRHRPARRQQRQPDRLVPARRRRQRQLDLPRRGLVLSAADTRGSCTPATPGGSTTASPSTTACAGTTTRRRPRSTTASRSSIRSAPTPAPAGGRAASPSPATATARPAMARAIRRRTGTAASRRASAPSTRSTTRRCSAPAGASSTRRRSIRAGAAASRRTASRTRPGFSSTLGGIQPAFYLDQGLPQNFQQPPDIRSDYRNGQGILYRPLDANERPYAHQWNISVDRELGGEPVAERRLRRQRGPPAAVEHRAAERDRSRRTCRWAIG